MKHNYAPILFTDSEEANNSIMGGDLDYHTLCVIHDCFGSVHPGVLAMLAKRGEIFKINPEWDCCRGVAWYKTQSAKEFPLCPARDATLAA